MDPSWTQLLGIRTEAVSEKRPTYGAERREVTVVMALLALLRKGSIFPVLNKR